MTEEELYEKAERIKADLEGLRGLGIKCRIVDGRSSDLYEDELFVAIEEIACMPCDEAWIGYDALGEEWYLGGLTGGEPEIYRCLNEDEFRKMLYAIARLLGEDPDIFANNYIDEYRFAKAEEQEWLKNNTA